MTDHIYDVLSLAAYGAYNRGRQLAGEVFPQFVQVNGRRKCMPSAKALSDELNAERPRYAVSNHGSTRSAVSSPYHSCYAGCGKQGKIGERKSKIPALKPGSEQGSVELAFEGSKNRLMSSGGSVASQKCLSNRSSYGVRASRIPTIGSSVSSTHTESSSRVLKRECEDSGCETYSGSYSAAELQNRAPQTDNLEYVAHSLANQVEFLVPGDQSQRENEGQQTSIFRKCLRVSDEIYEQCLSEGDFQDTARTENSETFDAMASLMQTQHLVTVIHQKARPESRTCEMSASDLRLDISAIHCPEERQTTETTQLSKVLSVFNSLAIKNRFGTEAEDSSYHAFMCEICDSEASVSVKERAAEGNYVDVFGTKSGDGSARIPFHVITTQQTEEENRAFGEAAPTGEVSALPDASEGRESSTKSTLRYRVFKRQTKAAGEGEAISFDAQENRALPGPRSSSAARKEYLAWDVWEDKSRGLFRNPQIVARKTVKCASNLGRLGKSEAYRKASNGKAK